MGTNFISSIPLESKGDIVVRGKHARIDVPELPIYIELQADQEITPVVKDFGTNLARDAKVVTSAAPQPNSEPEKINNGEFENWYWAQKPEGKPWSDDTPTFPVTVELDLPTVASVSNVIVYALASLATSKFSVGLRDPSEGGQNMEEVGSYARAA